MTKSEALSRNDLGTAPAARALLGAMPGDVVRAIKWIDAHLSEPLRIDTLADVAGVPARTLEAHFRQYVGMTPLGYLRQMRLAFAREQFLNSDGAINVTQVATASGFNQLGRFSAQYREAFGELPSQTKRRASRDERADAEQVDDNVIFLTWRAVSSAYQVAPKGCGDALEDVARAQELAPNYALAKAVKAWCLGLNTLHNFHMAATERADSIRLANEALALAPPDAVTLNLCSSAFAVGHRLDEAEGLIERAIAMEPWSPMSWLRRGWISAYRGDSDAALRELNYAMRLMPFEPFRHLAMIGIGVTHFSARRYESAVRWISEGVKLNPGSYWAERIVIAAAAQHGALDEARRRAKLLLRKEPDLTVEIARKAWPHKPDFINRLAEGLERAGIPRS